MRNGTNSRSLSRQAADSSYLSVNHDLPRKGNNLSRVTGEGDNSFDFYSRDSNRSATSLVESTDKKKNSQATSSRTDNDYWIHRDKLAKIETEELQRYGIHIPPPKKSRSTSKASSRRRDRSYDSHNNSISPTPVEQVEQVDEDESWLGPKEEADELPSVVLPEDHEKEQELHVLSQVSIDTASDDGEPICWDPRHPDEIAADVQDTQEEIRLYRHATLRKSSSRIPVLASSYVSLPVEHLEREQPLPRTRHNASGSMDATDNISYSKSRAQSQHRYSPEEVIETPTDTPSKPASRPSSRGNPLQASPLKPRNVSQGSGTPTEKSARKPPQNGRKASSGKPRSPAGKENKNNDSSSPAQRPRTRSGPESEPPWLANMYKPDPRLPPDQQLLPTVARKLQQEQWEREGKPGTMYDREFSPLAVNDSPEKQKQQHQEEKGQEKQQQEQEQQQQQQQQPSHPSGSNPRPDSTTQPPPNTKPSPPPEPSSGPQTGASSGNRGAFRTQEPPPPKPQLAAPAFDYVDPPSKKGCGCCVVM